MRRKADWQSYANSRNVKNLLCRLYIIRGWSSWKCCSARSSCSFSFSFICLGDSLFRGEFSVLELSVDLVEPLERKAWWHLSSEKFFKDNFEMLDEVVSPGPSES